MKATISHYRLDGELGRGGMGIVYRAVDTRLARAVALKILPTDAMADPDRRRRFVQEARSASTLNHPNIVTIYDIGEDDDVTFIAMELVPGRPLDTILAAGPLPLPLALDYARQIAAALAAAHASGIVHRDIKPANIIVTADGRAKVLDFGLAKLIERAAADLTITGLATRAGYVLGTAAYMSPEQAEGLPVDARSDVFSFGAMLYEMLAGRRPFAGDSDLSMIASLLRDTPVPLDTTVPAPLRSIVSRALSKDRAERYASGAELKQDLDAAHTTMVQSAAPGARRSYATTAIGVAVVAALAVGGFAWWQRTENRRARDARLRDLPQIERLMTTSKSVEAFRLAREIERYAPDEVARIRTTWLPFELRTEPTDASVEIRDYADVSGAWEPLGRTPTNGVLLPFAYYRVRLTKPGYLPIEFGRDPQQQLITLSTARDSPEGMVRVRGGPYQYGVAPTVNLEDYWIDKYEVTNRAFKKFVDAGGYRDPTYWREPFTDGDRVLPFAEAIARFRDRTGQTGPATWDVGGYPEGQDDMPVGGLSWFEAEAYATFVGKSLPSVYHWYRASGVDQVYSDILGLSNFDGNGPTRAGDRQGVGPWGTFDMAGNVKEWTANLVTGTADRYLLGGGWNEPSYRFNETDARNPWRRDEVFGVRLISAQPQIGAAGAPVGQVNPDPTTVVPVPSAEFQTYKRFYAYDRTPLDVRVESSDTSQPMYRKDRVSFAAAYGGERISAYLFIPKNVPPPYQTIILFPSAYATVARSSERLDLDTFEFIVKSGRALLYPVYKGTFERRGAPANGPSARRDLQVQWAKDFFRAVDYLQTRNDINIDRLGYFSLSMGAYFGPIPLALDSRIKTAVLIAAGLRYGYPPEIQPANFMPHVTIPVLTINGRDDFSTPLAAQGRVLELLGAPPDRKRHVALEGGHLPSDRRGLIREVLDWYDKYLGPVR